MSNVNETKQMNMNELTLFQQIAVEGEVAAIMNECHNDNEKLYFAYLKLALCEDKYLLVFKNEFMKYIDEDNALWRRHPWQAKNMD